MIVKFELYISKKVFSGKRKRFSSAIIALSIISIALGLMVMIISIGVSSGFQKAIKEKVAGFEGHIRISKFDYNQSYELSPIVADSTLVHRLTKIEAIQHINRFGLKGGILKNDGLIEGVIYKGVDHQYNWLFFSQYLQRGKLPKIVDSLTSTEILISDHLAKKIYLDTGSSILMYFVQDPPRTRKFIVSGIYDTGFEEFDANFIIGDLKQLQKLNDWSSDQVSGVEIHLKDFESSQMVSRKLNKLLDYDIKTETLAQRYPMIIDWLSLLDTNVYFIIGLMILISGITIIATLLILILEKTNFIGIMKSLGATNQNIRKIFLYKSINIIAKGLVLGNLIGLSLGFLQQKFQLIPLDSKNYYMDTVPFYISWEMILILNLGVLLITFLMVLWPSSIIAKISPIKAIRYK